MVSDTDASLKFYCDALGLKIAGGSLNFGTEQEHLHNVFGARLRITAVRAANCPGVEFLEYLVPRDGRPAPSDERANDLIHWQTRFSTTDTSSLARSLAEKQYKSVSYGVSVLTGKERGFAQALSRDPDGRVMQLIEK